MKKLITTIFILVSLISISCKAQTSNAQKAKPAMKEMKQMLKDSLHLTDVQIDSVVSIREEFAGKMKQLMADTSLSADQRKQQLKPLRQQMKMRLKTFLTKEQMQKLQQMQQGMHKGKMDEDGN